MEVRERFHIVWQLLEDIDNCVTDLEIYPEKKEKIVEQIKTSVQGAKAQLSAIGKEFFK